MSDTAKKELAEKMLAFWHIEPPKDSYLYALHEDEEMLLSLFDVRRLLGGLFRDDRVENEWLRARIPTLEAAPLDLILRGGDDVKKLQQFVQTVCGL